MWIGLDLATTSIIARLLTVAMVPSNARTTRIIVSHILLFPTLLVKSSDEDSQLTQLFIDTRTSCIFRVKSGRNTYLLEAMFYVADVD